jgi:hypothetical protein
VACCLNRRGLARRQRRQGGRGRSAKAGGPCGPLRYLRDHRRDDYQNVKRKIRNEGTPSPHQSTNDSTRHKRAQGKAQSFCNSELRASCAASNQGPHPRLAAPSTSPRSIIAKSWQPNSNHSFYKHSSVFAGSSKEAIDAPHRQKVCCAAR